MWRSASRPMMSSTTLVAVSNTYDHQYVHQHTPTPLDENLTVWTAETTVSRHDFHETSRTIMVFRGMVVLIAVIGFAANGLVALALGKSSALKKERFNALFLNQMILDMYACGTMAIAYIFKMIYTVLEGQKGYWLCVLLIDELPVWIGLNGSTANLVIVAVERYIMIVHPVWHKVGKVLFRGG